MSTSNSHHAFSPITAHDHRAYVWITGIICMIFVLLTFGARCYVRRTKFGVDDWANAALTVAGTAEFIVTFVGLSAGVGVSSTRLSTSELSHAGQFFVAAQGLAVAAIFLSKAATTLTVFRLLVSDMKVARRCCFVVLVTVTACGLASLLLVVVTPSERSVFEWPHYGSQTWRWDVVAGLDGFTELTILACVSYIIWPLHMDRRLKLTIGLMFGLRAFCPVFAALHAVAFTTFAHSTDRSLASAVLLVWQQIDVTYALLTSLALALKAFLQSFHINMGMDIPYNMQPYGPSSVKMPSQSISYWTDSPSEKRDYLPSTTAQDERQERRLDQSQFPHSARANHANGRPASIISESSERSIIRRDIPNSYIRDESGDIRECATV